MASAGRRIESPTSRMMPFSLKYHHEFRRKKSDRYGDSQFGRQSALATSGMTAHDASASTISHSVTTPPRLLMSTVPDLPSVPCGRYRHYKGREYLVLGIARHSETEEELVVYRPDYGDRGLWVRPRAMFVETVVVAGESLPRFRYVGPE